MTINANPGSIAYVDLEVEDNQGYVAVLIEYLLDNDYFKIKSICANMLTVDFDKLIENGESPYMNDDTWAGWAFNPANNWMVYMDEDALRIWSHETNPVFKDGNVARLAIEISPDTPEGVYEIFPNILDICTLAPDVSYYPVSMETDSRGGTITVTKKNITSGKMPEMPLKTRFYLPERQGAAFRPAGDIDGNYEVNAYDALLILQSVAGVKKPSIIEDVNQDSQITADDALEILMSVVG